MCPTTCWSISSKWRRRAGRKSSYWRSSAATATISIRRTAACKKGLKTLSRQELQIRVVKTEDMSSISDLEQACFDDPFPSYFLAQLAEANPDTFLVAVSNGQIIGYAVVDKWSDHQHLVSIAVLEQSRRKGIGQALLDELVQQIRNSPLRLEVRRRNKVALDFYLKNG